VFFLLFELAAAAVLSLAVPAQTLALTLVEALDVTVVRIQVVGVEVQAV
jgi:hypothetical protein